MPSQAYLVSIIAYIITRMDAYAREPSQNCGTEDVPDQMKSLTMNMASFRAALDSLL